MNNWYVSKMRGEDAPVLDVFQKPINGAARSQHSAHSNQSSTEAGASLLHAPSHGGRIDVARTALPDSAAAPPIAEFKRGDRVMVRDGIGTNYPNWLPVEFTKKIGKRFFGKCIAATEQKRRLCLWEIGSELGPWFECRHATPDEVARYWPESAAQVPVQNGLNKASGRTGVQPALRTSREEV